MDTTGYGHSAALIADLMPLLKQARVQSLIQDELNDERERLHHGHLSHEQRVSAGHHYETLRRSACEFNHQLRGFIEAHLESLSRDDLTRQLTTASAGRERWAEGEVTGAISEIALHAALMGMPELKGLRYAELDEDLRGYDFVAEWQGQIVTIDCKTGHYPPVTQNLHGHRHLEVSVPRDAVREFKVTRHGLDTLRRQVRQGLHQEAGVREHVTHAPYRPAKA